MDEKRRGADPLYCRSHKASLFAYIQKYYGYDKF